MRNAHGYAPFAAVCGIDARGYDSFMKPQPPQNTPAHRDPGRASHETHPSSEGGLHVNGRRPPPAVPHRRYPSLSDDGQPWFPRAPGSRRSETTSPPAITSREENPAEFSYVRMIAIAGIIVIIAALVGNA